MAQLIKTAQKLGDMSIGGNLPHHTHPSTFFATAKNGADTGVARKCQPGNVF